MAGPCAPIWNVEIKYEGTRAQVSVPSGSSVREFYAIVAAQLEVEPEFLKIIFKGKSLSYEDERLLSTCKVSEGAKMMALGRKGSYEGNPRLLEDIEKLLKEASPFQKPIQECLSELDGLNKGFLPSELEEDARKKLHKTSLQFAEELMKIMEKLDALKLDEKVPKARRKVAIQKMQDMLVSVDLFNLDKTPPKAKTKQSSSTGDDQDHRADQQS